MGLFDSSVLAIIRAFSDAECNLSRAACCVCFAEKFGDVQNAYEILSDDTKRQAYDLHGPAAFEQGGMNGGGGGGMGMGDEEFIDPRDFFERFVRRGGAGGRSGRSQR